ncbi:MAG: MMPL family transporter [Spirochaetota bacterium]
MPVHCSSYSFPILQEFQRGRSAGFGSLAVFRISFIRDFGIFTAIGIAYALILALTLVPACLTWLKSPRISGKVTAHDAEKEQRGVNPKLWISF